MDNLVISHNHISTSWIETLALEELNMDESGVVHIDDHLDPSDLLEEDSIRFMNSIRDRMELLVERFNQHRGGKQSEASVKIFKISNTVNDFMLFRNALRLVFARKSVDVISIGFLDKGGVLIPANSRKTNSELLSPHEIRAEIGPFNKIRWNFSGERVDLDALTRYYLSAFIRNSAR
ncbi:MAG: hypothetical protein HN353_05835 [Bdellovibrionales bacterium]|jgi:hypothetical protein|nr:hypothetical protein [Bdellovibrionales bacterium]MBT3527088.1 hypothetical protein [Bdellovibrionales bacterium]MBT7767914.1 hypothetical protein [Bdellovibrionales bacterium]